MIEFWTVVLALATMLYVILDGFDLGAGMLFPFVGGEGEKRKLLATISPVWDGNETWLVVTAATLFGAFPLVFSIFLSAFYVPLFLMLAGLILRGVAFEFRYKATRTRGLWDAGFVLGSFVAPFVQGAAVGAIVQGLPVENGIYAGNAFEWANLFSVLCGVSLCVGYALIGACWIVGKSEGGLRAFAYAILPKLIIALVCLLGILFVYSLAKSLRILDRWADMPAMLIVPVFGLACVGALWVCVARRRDRLLFPIAALIFLTAFGILAYSFFPYMLPFTITITQAAAPHASLSFLFWGAGLFVMPLTLIYTGVVYFIFRGKAKGEY